jgi:signal transduction histidine kinase
MNNNAQTQQQLLAELAQLRQRIIELEASEVKRQRVEAELRGRAHQQAVVAELGQRVLMGIELPDLLDLVVTRVAETLKAQFCQILELLPDRDIFLVRAGIGWREGVVGHATVDARPDSHLGHTLFSSEPIIVKNLSSDTRFTGFALLHDHRIVSGVSVIVDGEAWPFGVLSIHTAEQRIFTQDDINFLQATANVLATAIEHKRTQQALQEAHDQLEVRVEERTADLQTANEELKTFAYIVSHDLRAPLVNIKGFTSELGYGLETVYTVIQDILPQLKDEQRLALTVALEEDIPEALEFINSSVNRMNNLINAILKLSRLGRRELYFEPINMAALVQAHLETLAHQIERQKVNIRVGPLPNVVADKTAMEQIMGNILTNAVNYLDPSRPGQIDIYGEADHKETIFHVRDNGRGIAKEDMSKVFELFRRAGKQDVPGEGMGLAYVRALVRRHGGQIWCGSELNAGTTFSFSISRLQCNQLQCN